MKINNLSASEMLVADIAARFYAEMLFAPHPPGHDKMRAAVTAAMEITNMVVVEMRRPRRPDSEAIED